MAIERQVYSCPVVPDNLQPYSGSLNHSLIAVLRFETSGGNTSRFLSGSEVKRGLENPLEKGGTVLASGS